MEINTGHHIYKNNDIIKSENDFNYIKLKYGSIFLRFFSNHKWVYITDPYYEPNKFKLHISFEDPMDS